jgi:hypothetical protein
MMTERIAEELLILSVLGRLELEVDSNLVDLVPPGYQCIENPFGVIHFSNSLQKLDVVVPIASNRILVYRSVVHVLERVIQASLLSG